MIVLAFNALYRLAKRAKTGGDVRGNYIYEEKYDKGERTKLDMALYIEGLVLGGIIVGSLMNGCEEANGMTMQQSAYTVVEQMPAYSIGDKIID